MTSFIRCLNTILLHISPQLKMEKLTYLSQVCMMENIENLLQDGKIQRIYFILMFFFQTMVYKVSLRKTLEIFNSFFLNSLSKLLFEDRLKQLSISFHHPITFLIIMCTLGTGDSRIQPGSRSQCETISYVLCDAVPIQYYQMICPLRTSQPSFLQSDGQCLQEGYLANCQIRIQILFPNFGILISIFSYRLSLASRFYHNYMDINLIF